MELPSPIKKEKGPENDVRMGGCKGQIFVGLCEGIKERKRRRQKGKHKLKKESL
jgi:hypothetical protein